MNVWPDHRLCDTKGRGVVVSPGRRGAPDEVDNDSAARRWDDAATQTIDDAPALLSGSSVRREESEGVAHRWGGTTE